MFGSYPYPGNILENNTIEFINVYVKPGKPPKFPIVVKQANEIAQQEWVDLTQQVWFMYPEDVKREGTAADERQGDAHRPHWVGPPCATSGPEQVQQIRSLLDDLVGAKQD
jgi:hypothetical protein